MEQKESYIAVFNTTHETLRAEKWLKEEGLRIRTRIKPRSITSECGMALEFPGSAMETVREVCQRHRLKLIGLYRELEKDTWEKIGI